VRRPGTGAWGSNKGRKERVGGGEKEVGEGAAVETPEMREFVDKDFCEMILKGWYKQSAQKTWEDFEGALNIDLVLKWKERAV